MQCYVCGTPYALFLALNICNPEESDLFIANQYQSADKIVGVLKESGLFHNVSLIDEKQILHFKFSKFRKNPLYCRVSMFLRYVFLKYYMNRMGFRPCDYDALYFPYSFIGRMMYLYCKKSEADIRCFRFEDGVGDYVAEYEAGLTERDQFARKLIGIGKVDFELLLACPELYQNNAQMKVSRILFRYGNPEISAVMHKIFPCNADNWKYETVYFDTVRNEVPDEEDAKMDELLDTLKQSLADHFIIKPHPRENKRKEGFRYWSEGGNHGFEVDCCNHDFTNHILITISSTAVFIPKMIFDQEPAVILLYKLFDFTKGWDETGFVDRFRNTYRTKQKVMIPESFEQLYDLLELSAIT